MDPQYHSDQQKRQRLIGFVIIGAVIFLVAKQSHFSRNDAFYILLLMPAIILHEISHGAVAYMFGDETAKRAGRLTLNPLKHIDLFGTVLLPLLLTLGGKPPFGYAKPVPVSLNRLRNPRLHALFVGLAGPITNLCLAGLTVVAAGVIFHAGVHSTGVWDALYVFGLLNIVLAVFNLLPIPPLDGSSILEFFLPDSFRPAYYKFRRYAMILLLVLLLSGSSAVDTVLSDIRNPFINVYSTKFYCATYGCVNRDNGPNAPLR